MRALGAAGNAAEPRTSYEAPESCPSKEHFEAELSARLREAKPEIWAQFSFDVSVSERADEYLGSMFVLGPSQEVRRVLRDRDCTELVRAMAFVAAVLDGEEQPTGGQDGVANMRVIDAVYKSADDGRDVIL